MKHLSLQCIFTITLLSCTGCVSSSISDSIALIEREDSLQNSSVNKSVLSSIQTLRASQKLAKNNSPQTGPTMNTNSSIQTSHIQASNQSHTFAYELHNKELNYHDKIRLISLVVNKSQTFIISIALAKGTNRLDQLALSMARAEVLRMYISHFNNRVTIKFAPNLLTDTIYLVSGA
jgi:hypothetical protein